MLKKAKLSGNSCPPPGSVPHGNWTCKEQETPIIGTSFLDEDPQTYLGKTDKEFTQSIHLLKVVTTIWAFPNSGCIPPPSHTHSNGHFSSGPYFTILMGCTLPKMVTYGLLFFINEYMQFPKEANAHLDLVICQICEDLAQIPQILSGDFGWRVVLYINLFNTKSETIQRLEKFRNRYPCRYQILQNHVSIQDLSRPNLKLMRRGFNNPSHRKLSLTFWSVKKNP